MHGHTNIKATVYLLFASLKSVVCISLRVVKTPETFVTYVIFAIAALPKLIVLLISFLVQLSLVLSELVCWLLC